MGLRPGDVLDFSASVSPLGPPRGVRDALRQADLATYPDPDCLLLREAISAHLSRSSSGTLPIGRILAGNGSTEIIHLLARAYLSPPRPRTANSVFLLTPTYGEYAVAAQLAGAAVSGLDSGSRPGFRCDPDLAAAEIRKQRPSLVFLCNPNNPTGVFLGGDEVARLARASSDAGSLLVLDEAYVSFVEDSWDSPALTESGGGVLVRSMTKDYGLTALRLGYCVAREDVIERLASLQPDWSVNGLAQAAGVAALADDGYLPRVRKVVSETKAYLSQRLGELGFVVPPGAANFLLVQVGDAASWRARLMRRGLLVRDCASFGLPEYIRVGIRPLADCRRLADAMADLASRGPG